METLQYTFSRAIPMPQLPEYVNWDVWSNQQGLAKVAMYHYVDCACTACINYHFPCDDGECGYCATVREIIGKNGSMPIIDAIPNGIISFSHFMYTWPDDYTYCADDFIWKPCRNSTCEELTTGFERDNYDNYCSESCREACTVFYCDHCGDLQVDNEGDLCDYCANPDLDGGYEVYSDNFDTVDESWIAPDGRLYIVLNHEGHDLTARLFGFKDASAAEDAGWIHQTDAYGFSFQYIPDDFTDEQAATVVALCEAKDKKLPKVIKAWKDAQHSDLPVDVTLCEPMQNLSPSWLAMKRIERDRFYPLSGD